MQNISLIIDGNYLMQKSVFTLHKNRWEFKELIEFLSICKGMIGFNNISFDYPVIHHIWKNKKNFELLNNDLVINNIYIKAQECIVFSNI